MILKTSRISCDQDVMSTTKFAIFKKYNSWRHAYCWLHLIAQTWLNLFATISCLFVLSISKVKLTWRLWYQNRFVGKYYRSQWINLLLSNLVLKIAHLLPCSASLQLDGILFYQTMLFVGMYWNYRIQTSQNGDRSFSGTSSGKYHSRLTGLNSTKQENMLLVVYTESKPVKLETSQTMILPLQWVFSARNSNSFFSEESDGPNRQIY